MSESDAEIALDMAVELALISSTVALELARNQLLHGTAATSISNGLDRLASRLESDEHDEHDQCAAALHTAATLLRRVPDENRE